jgi:hypothetical protein
MDFFIFPYIVRILGFTIILNPLGAVTIALYVDVGDPTFVTVLRKLPLICCFGCGAFSAKEG